KIPTKIRRRTDQLSTAASRVDRTREGTSPVRSDFCYLLSHSSSSTYFWMLEAFTYFFRCSPSVITRVGACRIPNWRAISGFFSASMISSSSPSSIFFAILQLGQVLVVRSEERRVGREWKVL